MVPDFQLLNNSACEKVYFFVARRVRTVDVASSPNKIKVGNGEVLIVLIGEDKAAAIGDLTSKELQEHAQRNLVGEFFSIPLKDLLPYDGRLRRFIHAV